MAQDYRNYRAVIRAGMLLIGAALFILTLRAIRLHRELAPPLPPK